MDHFVLLFKVILATNIHQVRFLFGLSKTVSSSSYPTQPVILLPKLVLAFMVWRCFKNSPFIVHTTSTLSVQIIFARSTLKLSRRIQTLRAKLLTNKQLSIKAVPTQFTLTTIRHTVKLHKIQLRLILRSSPRRISPTAFGIQHKAARQQYSKYNKLSLLILSLIKITLHPKQLFK